MKRNYFLITLLTIGFISCQTNESKDIQNQTLSEQVIEQIQNLPDTVLTSKNIKQNEFQADLSNIKIDIQKTTLLGGEWITQNGSVRFLNTTLDLGDKVIFYDTTRSSMTGWGTIRYNRAANFYFTESGSYMYEFYVVNDNKLVLTQYDYRNDDLTMKEKPESISRELDIEFINDDKVKVGFKGQTVELKRK